MQDRCYRHSYWILLISFLVVYRSCHGRKLELEKRHVDMDPSLHVFFTPNDLKAGKKLTIFFPIKNFSESPKLLPREVADSLPFSASNLSYLLEFFSIPRSSPRAKAMEYTLTQCELEPMTGETKFCATSLESLLDSTRGVFGLDVEIKAVTTRYPRSFEREVQNYTVLKESVKIGARKIVSCHTMAFPYVVYYCHSQRSDKVLYKVELRSESESGEIVEGVAICHVDTSEWDEEHVVFKVLKVKPGGSAVCHFYPADNIAWIPDSDDSVG